MTPPIPVDRVCIALDTPDLDRAVALARSLSGLAGWMKVGMTLFGAHGPRAVEAVAATGARVFLDLKFHDIPAQVKGAVASAASAGASLCTVHASGGPAMLAAAAEGRSGGLRVVAVTVLTSLSAQELGVVWPGADPASSVARLTQVAVRSGVDGIVLSPAEVVATRSSVPRDFWLVVPGVRPEGGAMDDQARTGTPRQALADGADLLVIGRPVTGAADPAEALREIRGVR